MQKENLSWLQQQIGVLNLFKMISFQETGGLRTDIIYIYRHIKIHIYIYIWCMFIVFIHIYIYR